MDFLYKKKIVVYFKKKTKQKTLKSLNDITIVDRTSVNVLEQVAFINSL